MNSQSPYFFLSQIYKLTFKIYNKNSIKKLPIQPPNTNIQNTGKTHPKQIRNKQIARNFVNFSKFDVGFINHQPKQDNFDACQHGVSQSKKQKRPQGIQSQLNYEKNQSFSNGFSFKIYTTPNQTCRNSHHDV